MDQWVSEPSLPLVEDGEEGEAVTTTWIEPLCGLDFPLDVADGDAAALLVKSLAALAIPDSLRRQRWVPASPGGQHADR